MGAGPLFESLESRQHLTGVTLITHGWQATSARPAWIDAMANHVATRAGAGASIYNMVVGVSGNSASVVSFNRTSGVAPSSSSNPEIIITLDWVAATGVIFSPTFSAGDIAAKLVAPLFFATSPASGITQPLAQLPVHLIGHSRGASLVSALARSLGAQGLWIDQVTTLDPYPVSDVGDPAVSTTNNIIFADNYYQSSGYPAGSAVSGAANVDLTGRGYDHTGIHDYYDETIYNGVGGGFAWSRIGSAARPTQGLLFSGAGRNGLTVTASGAAVWDNVQISDWRSSSTVAQGGVVTAQFDFLDVNTDARLTFGLDVNANPYDGAVSGGAVSTYSTTVIGLGPWTPSLATNSVAPGVYRLYAKIENGLHARYYYAPGSLTVTPETTRPTASTSAFNVTAAGASNYTFTVTYSDNIAIDVAGIDGADIKVTGPNGFSQLAQRVGVNDGTNGTPRTATYKITPPGGTWNSQDNGSYTLALQANQVYDVAGNAVAASAALKTFSVAIPTTPPPPSVGSVSGTVFLDADASGLKEKSEKTPLSARVYLDRNNNGLFDSGEPSAMSDSRSGNFSLNAVAPGVYALRHVPPTGYRQTLPRKYWTVTVSAGAATSGMLFGDTSLGFLSGVVFKDANSNKLRDGSEAGFAGWRVYLDQNNNGKWETTELSAVADSTGYFALDKLSPGTYTLRIVLQSSWKLTTVSNYKFTLGSGQVIKTPLFGLKQ